VLHVHILYMVCASVLEEEIFKKVEESINTDEVKLEMKSKIEEGC
jgi:hypothetical protein